MPDLIEVEHLVKHYRLGDLVVQALRGVSLRIARGDFVAIMGASGSGKSTLMNILGCLDRPTAGTYRLDGIDVARLSKDELARIRNKKIGFVFQTFNLLGRTSALENVELPLLYNGTPTHERRAQAFKVLHAVGLAGREHHHPGQLSGGEQQRVAIARALVNAPSLILADEPTGNLDSRSSVELMVIFQQLNRDAGITLVLVTHELEIAAYANRMVHFRDGRIVKDEPNVGRRLAEEVLRDAQAEEG